MGFRDRIKKAISNNEKPKGDFYSLIHKGVKEINLNRDFYLTETIIIDVDDIILDGQGHTIHATGNKQILFITANNITLKNITFKNAHSDNDGGAIFNLNGSLKIVNCDFIDNHTDMSDGGAIYNDEGHVIIEDCDFNGNSAKFGGAIYNGNTLKLTGCNFSNNHSTRGPSIFNSSKSKVTLINSHFEKSNEHEIHNMGTLNIENHQKDAIREMTYGGFIHIISEDAKSFRDLNLLVHSGKKEITLDCDIVNSNFKEGIVIDEDGLTIDGCGHSIDGVGQANILKIISENVTIRNVNFRNGFAGEGGAINNFSKSLKLEGCDFEHNISRNGGAIHNEGKINLKDCSFKNNIAHKMCGGAINNIGELALVKCKFLNNLSAKNGGAINNAGKTNIEKCCFKSNASENGASINNLEGAFLKVHESEFEHNKASKQGSILYNKDYAHINNCKSFNNISNNYSNIIFQNGDENACLEIENSEFSRDRFNNNLIFLENGSCDIKSSIFNINKEYENSYIIYNENAVVKVKNLEFENINKKVIYNNNVLWIEKDENMEKYIESVEDNSNLKYN